MRMNVYEERKVDITSHATTAFRMRNMLEKERKKM